MAKQSDCYHNPDPLYCLIGNNNESEVALIDSGSQVSSITQDLATQFLLPVHTLAKTLNIEGMEGQRVLYIRYVEV